MKVKVILEKGETRDQADELLLKALASHQNGEAHEEDSFLDPAMQDVAAQMVLEYQKVHESMMREISEALDEEFE